LHRGLNCLDALGSCRDGFIESNLKPLIDFDQLRVITRLGNRRL
jgi:hypothetical protein